jgi:hypothetical protein
LLVSALYIVVRRLLGLVVLLGRRERAKVARSLMELAQQVRMRSGDAGRELRPAVAPR